MTKQEKVDSYLNMNKDEILKSQQEKTISWKGIATKASFAANEYVDSEYIRNRFLKFRQKNEKQFLGELKEKYNFTLDIEQSKTNQSNSLPGYLANYSYQEDRDKGTAKLEDNVKSKLSDDDIYIRYSVDKQKYKISAIYYKDQAEGFRMTVLFRPIVIQDVIEDLSLSDDFLDRVSRISPLASIPQVIKSNKPKACLLIPKQDAHWNKFDISGNNSIEDRFSQFSKSLSEQLEKARFSNDIEEIIYILGSDEFNSEWTTMTTKGTPQQNILTYEDAFEKITNFNIETIKILKYYAQKVTVVLLNGNHDRYSGWHLSHVLKAVFKKNEGISVDDSTDSTKILSYKSNLVCLNHGDSIKPKDLAAKFPIIANKQWSDHSNYYVVCGDKHHEVAHDFNGIMFYQVPQLSTAKSAWDERQGFCTSKAELMVFLFEEDGLSNIMRKIIK